MEAIRIEYSDGNGLFRAIDIYGFHVLCRTSCYIDILDRHEEFKTPQQDSDLENWFTQEYYCAFKSIDQLKEWFKDEHLQEIISIGFRVYRIKLRDWLKGEYQIIYKKDNILCKTDITDTFL